MSKMVQIRNMPDDIHREMKARAARAGMSLSDYLLREVEHIAARRPLEELLEAHRNRVRPRLSETPAEMVRRERDSR
jgi:plasmid stability protein